MGVSKNTVKSLSKRGQDLSIIMYDGKQGNDILYRRCQKGVKKGLIGVNWKELHTYFEGVKGVKNPQSTDHLVEIEEMCKEP